MTPKSKHSRFLHLERPRAERGEPAAPSTALRDGGRFETLEERREALQEAAIPETHLERFRGQAPLALADMPEDVRRFPRCALCESENGRFAKACAVCGADLGTPEQLEFNERLWQERRKTLSRTQEDEAEALRQLEEARKQEEARKHEAAEHFERQLQQLRAEEGSSRWIRAFSEHSTVGSALLALIPNPRVRPLVLAGLILLGVGLWRYGAGGARLAGVALCVVLAGLFLPRRGSWRH